MKKITALVLLSGGLDSILAVKLLQKQGIKVTGLCLVSYFFNAQLAKKAAKNLGIKLKIVDFSDQHLAMVKKPKHGYGKIMNPCLDCHILMLEKAKKIMAKEKFNLVATGEVLGERPFSQNKQALKIVERESGLEGYLLRPLSARLLEPTIPEKRGWVNRRKLLAIKGRCRRPQITLAKKWGLPEYPQPAGGCLLTDPQFGQRLKELLEKWPDCHGNDIQLLKIGRHFWAGPASFGKRPGANEDKLVVGRNEQENKDLEKLKRPGDIVIKPRHFPGPTILIRGRPKIRAESLVKAKELMIKYSPKLRSMV